MFVLAGWGAQRAVQLGFGNINSEMKQWHINSSDDLPCECGLPASRAKDTVRSFAEDERLLQESTLLAQGQGAGTASSRSALRCPLRQKHNTRGGFLTRPGRSTPFHEHASTR